MPTTPSSEASKTTRNSKKTLKSGLTGKPFNAVTHEGEPGLHPVDTAVERRLPARSLRRRISRLTQEVVAALGARRRLWLSLEESINELHSDREEEYFNLGFEHGFAAGRSMAAECPIRVRTLAAHLRDHAIQIGGREHGLPALLAAALGLASPAPIPKATREKKAR